MKVNYDDVVYVLSLYGFGFENDTTIQENLANHILDVYRHSKTLLKIPNKISLLFREFANYDLDRKLARKIVYDIACETELTQLFEELKKCNILKDKLNLDRRNDTITLKVHDDFIVKTYLTLQKTFINGIFYDNIEVQDLSESYCDFVSHECFYVMYNKRRLPSFIGLSKRYFKILTDKSKLLKPNNRHNVNMIFTNTELIYRSV